jgi:hypothetical protein
MWSAWHVQPHSIDGETTLKGLGRFMMQTVPKWTLMLFLFVSGGCGDNSDDSLQKTNVPDGAATVSTTDVGVETVSLTGMVVEAPAFTAYAGAVGCVLDSDPQVCAVSDDNGIFQIDLPANSMTGVTFEIPGMIPFLNPIATGDADIVLYERGEWVNPAISVVLPSDPTYDPAKGQVDFEATRLNGGSVTTNVTYSDSWLIEVVFDGDTATETGVLLGFTDVDSGMATFRAEKDGAHCTWDPVVWPGDEPGTVTIPIRAGWWTRLFEVACP